MPKRIIQKPKRKPYHHLVRHQKKIAVEKLIFVAVGVAVILIAVYLIKYLTKRPVKTVSELNEFRYSHQTLKKPVDLNPPKAQQEKIRLPIIMYHYVEFISDPNDHVKNSLTINPYLFENQIKTFVEAGFKTYFAKEIPEILDGKIDSFDPDKSVVLTFDDGYEDFYDYVLPILKKYNVKATQYIIYDYIGRKGFLNEKEIHELVKSGLVEIGSHTLDHAYLKNEASSSAQIQIDESKTLLEKRFGIPIETFAYPYGAFSQNTLDFTKEASYSAALSVIPGIIQSRENLFYLSRIRAGALTPQYMISFLHNYPSK